MEIEKLLDDAIATLDGAGVTWAVMGGCARNAYAEPRATRDVDFVVEADSARFQALERALRGAGFERATTVDEPGGGVDLNWSYVERWCDEWELRDRLAKTRLELGE